MIQKTLGPACVWMRAGVIRLWLCDRDFDCDNCPLDAALRGPRTWRPEDPTVQRRRKGDALPEDPPHRGR